jgi:hypothetical protein
MVKRVTSSGGRSSSYYCSSPPNKEVGKMRRAKLILGVSAVMMAMMIALAAPAMADDFNRDDFCDVFDCNNNDDDFCDFFDCNNNNDFFCDDDFFFDNCGFDRFGFNDGFGSQDFEQDADSGDIDQSFDVTGGGDNSNQTVGLQGVANTGNAQNQIGITQIGSDADDFSFEDSGASIEVSPTNTTTSDQKVNQAASASGR